MQFFSVFFSFVAILHTASALPYRFVNLAPTSTPFLDNTLLPACVHTCTVLNNAITRCSPPAVPTSNNATYIDCFCKIEGLREYDTSGGMCNASCDAGDEKTVERAYDSLCGTTSSYDAPTITLASLSTVSPTIALSPPKLSPSIVHATSALSFLTTPTISRAIDTSTQTSPPTVEGPQSDSGDSETWYVDTMYSLQPRD